MSNLNATGQSIVMVTHTFKAAERGNRVIYLSDGVISDEIELGNYVGDYKDEILGYNPGGERLSDLFTHKFGNALIYTLIHEEAIDDVVVRSLQATEKANDSFEWFEYVVKIVFNKMFNLRL